MRFFEAQKPLYLLAIVSFAGFATAAYTAVEDYTPGDYSSFFSKFTFYDGVRQIICLSRFAYSMLNLM